ncbi:MAG: high light inducible protein [Minisyncoccia bacterium]
MKFGWTHENLKINGRLAMVGFVAMVGSYLVTGQVIPGVW